MPGAGAAYCSGCRVLAKPCAGKCPYEAKAPLSGEGAALWTIIQSRGVLKLAGMDGRPAGLEWPAALALAQTQGIPAAVAAAILLIVEPRLIMALNGQQISDE